MRFKQDLVPLDFDLPDYPSLIAKHAVPAFQDGGVYAGIASIPRRVNNLRLVLQCLYNQVDHFFVYLNDYDTVPAWIEDPKISYFRSQDYVDLNATGKVFFAGVADRGYFLTLDDDFIYPGDYAAQMVGAIQRYDNRVAACVHASIFPPEPDFYYVRTAMYQYQSDLAQDRFVCMPGSGSFAFKAGTLDMSIEQFLPQVMVDLACGILCKSHGVPLVSVRRLEGWLQNTDREGLYQEFTKQKTHHTHYALKAAPWDFREYAPAIEEIRQRLMEAGIDPTEDPEMDNDAFRAARDGHIPRNWTLTSRYYSRLSEYVRAEASGLRF